MAWPAPLSMVGLWVSGDFFQVNGPRRFLRRGVGQVHLGGADGFLGALQRVLPHVSVELVRAEATGRGQGGRLRGLCCRSVRHRVAAPGPVVQCQVGPAGGHPPSQPSAVPSGRVTGRVAPGLTQAPASGTGDLGPGTPPGPPSSPRHPRGQQPGRARRAGRTRDMGPCSVGVCVPARVGVSCVPHVGT